MNHLDLTTLNLYLDDALDTNARAQADTHLATCETCQRELASLQSLATTFHAWSAEPIPHDVSLTVMTRLANRPAPAFVSRWGPVLLGGQVLFATLVLLWLLPMLLRFLDGLPFEFVPTFALSDFRNLVQVSTTFALPLPPLALWIWLVALVGIVAAWLIGNRLLFSSLEHSRSTSQEASQ